MDTSKKPDDREISEAVEMLGALAYFPAEAGARRAVAFVLRSMVNTTKELRWLVNAMLNQAGQWRGTVDIRGIFCTRFKPADGQEAVTSTAGFSAEDMEAIEMRDTKQINAAQPRSGAGLLSAAEIKLDLKLLDPIRKSRP